MITTTYTYINFWSSDETKKPSIDALEKQLSAFTETQTDVNLEDFLRRFLEKKPLLDTIGIEKIAIFHTLLYDNQCNTEFSPTVMDLIQKIGATFCISMDCIRRNKRIYNVPSADDGIMEETIERFSNEINAEIPYAFDEESEVLFANIDATDLEDRQVFELGFRYGQQTEFQKKVAPKNLYKVLDLIRERPAMYTGEHSLTAIYHFVNGFYMACDHETSESPSFDGFNDFVGKFYGKYTTAGWKNLILSDHYGNEAGALTRFYELLDEYRETPNKPNARHIIHQLLHQALMDMNLDSEHRQQVMDLLEPTSKELHGAIYMRLLSWYETLLEDIFLRARGNNFLHNWIKDYTPTTAFYEYQLWETKESGEIVAIKTSELPSETPNAEQKTLLQSFFAINDEAINELKEHFIRNKEQNKIMQKHNLTFFTEYYQFYILDSETKSQTDDANFWNDEAGKLRLAVLEGLLGVTVGKYAKINVEVRVLEEKPSIFDYPDHVVEASLRLPSGILQIKDCTAYDTELELKLEKGCYRVRISSFKLYTIQNDSGDDHYLVEIWKSRFAKPKVLVDYAKV